MQPHHRAEYGRTERYLTHPQPALHCFANETHGKKDRSDQQSVRPRQGRRRQQQRRAPPARVSAFDLLDAAQYGGDHQQLEQLRLQPARAPHGKAAAQRQPQRGNHDQPRLRAHTPPAEPNRQRPQRDPAAHAEKRRAEMRRDARDRVQPAEQHYPEEIGVPLDRFEPGIEHQSVAVAKIARVPKGDERIVGQKPVGVHLIQE